MRLLVVALLLLPLALGACAPKKTLPPVHVRVDPTLSLARRAVIFRVHATNTTARALTLQEFTIDDIQHDGRPNRTPCNTRPITTNAPLKLGAGKTETFEATCPIRSALLTPETHDPAARTAPFGWTATGTMKVEELAAGASMPIAIAGDEVVIDHGG
jgi:hypothetical protein